MIAYSSWRTELKDAKTPDSKLKTKSFLFSTIHAVKNYVRRVPSFLVLKLVWLYHKIKELILHTIALFLLAVPLMLLGYSTYFLLNIWVKRFYTI